MSVESGIWAAFVLAWGNPMPTAWPLARSFSPPETGPWAEVRMLPSDTINRGMADDGPRVHLGIFAVMVYVRPGAGLGPALAQAKIIMDKFAKGTMLGMARVESPPSMSGAIDSGDKVGIPIRIPYRATIA